MKWNLFEKRWFLNANPSLWFVLVYMFIMAVVIIIFRNRFEFSGGMGLFTFFWTFLAVMILHSLLNIKRFRLFIKHKQKHEIRNSYLHASYQYIPYLLVAIVYEFIFFFQKAFSRDFRSIDLLFMRWDEFLFGVQPTIWLENFTHPLAVEYFMFAYVLFLVYPYFFLVYLYQKNQIPVFHKVMLAQIIALIITLAVFVILPAKGPRATFEIMENNTVESELPAYQKPLEGVQLDFLEKWTGKRSFFQLQYDMWNQIERIKMDCMPSMHTCLCLIALFYALKYRRLFKYRKTALWFWLVGNISLIFSTVYLRYHWVVDVIAGALLAGAAFYLTEIFYKFWLRQRYALKLNEPKAEWLITAEQIRKPDKKEKITSLNTFSNFA